MTERMEFVKKFVPSKAEVSDEALRLLIETFPESPEVLAWHEYLRLAEDHRRLEAAKLKIAQTRAEIADIWATKVPAVRASLEMDAPERGAVFKEQTDQLLKKMRQRSKAVSRILKENNRTQN